MSQPAKTRILAVDVRSSRLGFAVFEVPIRLLDWGKRSLGSGDSCSKSIAWLLRRFGVSFVVIRRIRSGGRRDTLRVRQAQRIIRREARRRSVLVVMLSERVFSGFFRRYERHRKFEIAALMGGVFPEIMWILPRPRKCYEPESSRMSVFDAVALGVAFLGTTVDDESANRLVASAAGVLSPASR